MLRARIWERSMENNGYEAVGVREGSRSGVSRTE